MTTPPEMQLRNFEWTDLQAFHRLLQDIGAHGHRDWPTSVEGLRADLEYPRDQPEKNIVLARTADGTAGYAIVEPEQNIDRSVVGVGVDMARADDAGATTGMLLDWATERASQLASRTHLATRDSETRLSEYVGHLGWKHVRKYLRLESGPGTVRAAAAIPDGFTMRPMQGLDELPELVDLQNTVFKAHFGFSPNTVEELRSRLTAPGAAVNDVVMVHDAANSGARLVAYCWTTIHERADSNRGRIGMTGVLPDARGRGLGRAIAESGYNHLLDQGAKIVELEVDSVNTPAIKIYSSLGFVTVGRVDWWER